MDNNNVDSILNTVKKLLGITPDYTHFDEDIIIHINTVFMALQEMGIGPEEGYFILGSDESWSDFMDEGTLLNSVKTYVCLRVRSIFDPPTSSSANEAITRMISELEFRMMILAGS